MNKKTIGNDVIDHFIDVNKMVELGSGAHRVVDDLEKTLNGE